MAPDTYAAVTDGGVGLVSSGAALWLVGEGGQTQRLSVDLPSMRTFKVGAVADGFVVGGFRCEHGGEPNVVGDAASSCTPRGEGSDDEPGMAVPVVAHVSARGELDWTMTGPVMPPDSMQMSGGLGRGALVYAGFPPSFYLVTASGFEQTAGFGSANAGDVETRSTAPPCQASDGSAVSIWVDWEPGRSTSSLVVDRSGAWTPVGTAIESRDPEATNWTCVGGGALSGVVLANTGTGLVARDATAPSLDLARVRGVTADARILYGGWRNGGTSSAPGLALVDWATGSTTRTFPTAIAGAMSPDGTTALIVSSSSAEVVEV